MEAEIGERDILVAHVDRSILQPCLPCFGTAEREHLQNVERSLFQNAKLLRLPVDVAFNSTLVRAMADGFQWLAGAQQIDRWQGGKL